MGESVCESCGTKQESSSCCSVDVKIEDGKCTCSGCGSEQKSACCAAPIKEKEEPAETTEKSNE